MTSSIRIPKRILSALMNSISAGVTPRAGIEHLAVGRKNEIDAILSDLDLVGDGGSAFRVIEGPFGAGKSFLLALARNYALERNYVVMDADLSPERRLTGTQGQGLATYRELTRRMATKTCPDGGAMASVLERWISTLQSEVLGTGVAVGTTLFADAVERLIVQTVGQMEGLVHGFDFGQVLAYYWRGTIEGDETKKAAALRWLRGEYSTKTEARSAMGGVVRVMIDDDTWYDYVKLLASFVTAIGYKGMVVAIDEAVNLYKISHKQAREANYEKLLTILNDCLQGRAQALGVLVGATPKMVQDAQRGLFSYEALKSRLKESHYAAKAGMRDMHGPVISLDPLTSEEVFVLLRHLCALHESASGVATQISDAELHAFMSETLTRLGAERFSTPREAIRDFITILNLLAQDPSLRFLSIVSGFKPTAIGAEPDDSPILEAAPVAGSKFTSFTL